MSRSLVVDAGLDKLQELLLAMGEGDQVTLPQAMAISGLDMSHCEAVFDALTRIGLMTRTAGDAYVRTHLAD